MMESSEADEARKIPTVEVGQLSYSGFPVRVLTRPDQRECKFDVVFCIIIIIMANALFLDFKKVGNGSLHTRQSRKDI